MNVLVQHRLDRERFLAEIAACPECGDKCEVCSRNEMCCLGIIKGPREEIRGRDHLQESSRLRPEGEEEASLE